MRWMLLALVGLAAGCSRPAEEATAPAPATPPTEAAASAMHAAPEPIAEATPRVVDGPRLSFPLDCVIGRTCEVQNYADVDPGPGAKDYRCGTHTYEAHGGTDIRIADMAAQRRGVDVLAAAPGRVARLRDGVPDVSVRIAGRASVAGGECGNGLVIDHGGGWETQYCHLARGSLKVKQGDTVTAGQPIARVGLSGMTEYPHLHLSVRRAGVMVEAFRPEGAAGSCDPKAAGSGLWDARAAKAMAYRSGAVLNAGFAAAPVTMEAVEAGGVAAPGKGAPMMIAYVRAIGLEGGDIQSLSLAAPDGAVISKNTLPPLEGPKAQYLLYVGKRAPAEGWASGKYRATYEVRRGGRLALTRTFDLAL